MRRTKHAFIGHWRITEMETWDADYFDMDVPAHIIIRKDLTGEFQLGMVQGELDGRVGTRNGVVRFEFSWSGFDENDPVNGRGWLAVNDDLVEGRIFIHLGDDSALKAVRQP